jgi:hypothetical protein
MPRLMIGLSLAAVAAIASGCGGPTSTLSSTSAPAATPSSSPTASASPTPAAPSAVVWEARHATGGGQEIRLVPATGPAHTVTTLTPDAQLLAAGHGKLVAVDADHVTLRVLDLGSGTSVAFAGGTGGGSGELIFGGALSPDSSHFAFVDAVSPTSSLERIADLATHTVTTVRTISDNRFDSPVVWGSGGIGAVTLVGFADAGQQAAQMLDPTTMARVHTTADTGICAISISDDASHAADAMHSGLGDEGDAPAGPGPPRPCNTLRTFAIGGTPATVLSEAHHNINVVAQSGTSVCFYDDSAVGGVAGISLSPSFGLFLLQGGTPLQLAHWDGRYWGAGAFVNGDVVAANGTDPAASTPSGPAKLVRFAAAGGTMTVLDTVADASPGLVATV